MSLTGQVIFPVFRRIPYVAEICVSPGIYQFDLFRALPDRPQLQRLIEHFDQSGGSSQEAPQVQSLSQETMPNICALLNAYIKNLPVPLVPWNLFNALWVWCVLPACQQENEGDRWPTHISSLTNSSRSSRNHQPGGPDRHHRAGGARLDQMDFRLRRSRSGSGSRRISLLARHPLAAAQMSTTEAFRITLARYILLLLHPRCFALLNYLLTFFSQLPLSPSNGITYDEISRLFAPSLLGGPRKTEEEDSTDSDKDNATTKIMMTWLLSRWSVLLDGFDNMSVSDGFGSETEDSSANAEERLGSLFTPSDAGSDDSDATLTNGIGSGHPKSIMRNGSLSRNRRAASDGPRTRRVSFSEPLVDERSNDGM